MRKVTGVFFRLLLSLLVLAVMALAALTLALRTPAMQTRVVRLLADSVSRRLGYPVRIGRVRYTWFDELALEQVSLRDPRQRPMIDVERLDVNFKLSRLLAPFPTDSFTVFGYPVRYKNYTKLAFSNRIPLDRVRLLRPRVALVVNPRTRDLNIDEFIAKIDSLTAPKVPNPHPGPDPPFTIDEATVQDGTFSYDDPRTAPLHRRGTFDYNHFVIKELNAELANFLLVADTVAFQADNLRGYDPVANLRIRELDTRFFFSKKQMRFDGLLARVNRSVIRRNVAFLYGHRRDLGDFNEKVRIVADLDSTVVFSDDLARFSRPLYAYRDVWRASGHMNGTVRDFRFTNARLFFGKQSRAFGTVAFRGLPDFEASTMDFDLKNSVATLPDLLQYVGKNTASAMEKFFPLRMDATFRGRSTDFRTAGQFRTPLGYAEPDLTMKLTPKSANSTYRGTLKLVDFDLGKLIDDPRLLQKTDLSGRVEGRGFALDDAVLHFDGSVARLGIRGYDYRRADVNGQLQRGLFDGQVTLRDTNLVFDLAGRVDLRQKLPAFDLTGKLARANLKPLGFAAEDLRLQSELDVNFEGLNLDQLAGTLRLRNTFLTLDKRSLVVDTLIVQASRPTADSPDRQLVVRSNLLEAAVTGPFRFAQVAADLPRLVEEYRIYFSENEAARQAYYARRAGRAFPRYDMHYAVVLKNSNPLMAFFYPDGYLSPKATLEGELRLGNTSVFTLNARADTLFLGKYKFFGSEIDLNTSKFANRPDVLASAVVTSKKQDLSRLADTEALEWEGSWEQDRILFTSGIRQTGSPNRATLNGTVRFTPVGTELSFRRGQVRVENGEWLLSPGNLISLAGDTVRFRDVTFRNVEQSVSVAGVVSRDSTQTLRLNAEDFRLETLAQLVNLDLKGTFNAAVTVRDVYRNLNLEGSARVDELVYENFYIGNFDGDARWDALRQQVNVSAAVDRMTNRIVTVKGVFDPKKEENSLNLLATLSQTDLEILSPFTQGLFSNLGGTASGQVRIQGTPTFPQLSGTVDIRRGRLTFDYLKTTLRFEDKIYFDGNDIAARGLRLTDEEGNPGTLSGGVFYDGAGHFALSLTAKLTNFKVLNTKARDNALFYGTGYVTTTGPGLEILGPFDNLTIRASATTNRNTRIYIPFDNAASVSNDDFITLLSEKLRQDSLQRQAAKAAQPVVFKRRDDSRIQLFFDFNVTPDAYMEIQLNRQTGEGISANGRGRLRLGIDTQGDFTMSGVYTMEQGKYVFKYANLIDKPFDIRAGSRISWAGDPYEALIDIKASYRTLASLSSVLQLSDTERKDPQYQRRYPIAVVINLNDRLLSPSISYNLEIKDYPKISPFVRDIPAFEARLQSDEQFLSRQVSSVLAFGSLLPDGTNQSFGQVNVLNNLTELAANQLSTWLSQINPNLQINYLSFNGASTTANPALIGDPRASISYNFRDRIRITRDGGFSNSAYIGSANLIGDWSLEVLITKDARWRGRAFNRFVQNPFAGTLNNQSVANFGASLLYTQSFNYFFRPRTTLLPITPVLPPGEKPVPVEQKSPATGGVTNTTSQVGPRKSMKKSLD
jgi:hypothetical protein